MRNTLKLSLLTILAIPLFIMNVSAKEIVNENNTYQRGTFTNKTYDFSETVEDFQELQINGTPVAGVVLAVDEDTLSIDWNYLEDIYELFVGDNTLSFIFTGETVETTLTIVEDPNPVATINGIFSNISTEFQTAAVEADALVYDDSTWSYPVIDDLTSQVVDRLAEAGYHLDSYGYGMYISSRFYETGDVRDYTLEIYVNADEVDIPLRLTFSNSYLRNDADRATVQAFIDNNNFLFVKFVPLIEALEAHRNGTTESLYDPLNERMQALASGTGIEFSETIFDMPEVASHIIYAQYFLSINGIIYGVIDPVGGYVSSIEHPGEDIDLNVYSRDYIAQQLVLYEIMADGDVLNYSTDSPDAYLTRGDAIIDIGNIHLLEPYEYLEGENSTVTPEDPLSVRIDGDVDEFLYVAVDDQEVNSAYYTVTAGSTVIDFSTEFTSSLAEGVHDLVAYFIFGKAATTFTVANSVVEEVATSTTTTAVRTNYTANTVYQPAETKKEELKEVSEDKKDKPKDDKKDDEKEETSKGGGGKGFVIGIIIAILIAGIGFYLYKEGQE